MATVSDLTAVVKRDEGRFHKRQLADVSIARGSDLRVGDLALSLDEDGLNVLGKHLGIPKGYLGKLSPDLVDQNVRYFLNKESESFALFEVDGNDLAGVYDASKEILPRGRVAEVIQSVLDPDATLNALDLSQGRFVVDVTTTGIVTQPRVGDFTYGGLRFATHIAPTGAKATHPRVSCYMNRLVCLNGMTHEEEFGEISIKGNTVDDVISEMEEVARHLLENQVPALVERFGGLAERPVSNAEQFVHRLVRQFGIKAAVETAILERLPELGDETTIYDVLNLVSGFQHEEGVQRAVALRLQHLAGETAWGADDDHRCPTCQTRLEA